MMPSPRLLARTLVGLSAAAAALVPVAVGAPALAAGPERIPYKLSGTVTFPTTCADPVRFDFDFDATAKIWRGDDGYQTRVLTTGRHYTAYTNLTTGKTFVASRNGVSDFDAETFEQTFHGHGTLLWLRNVGPENGFPGLAVTRGTTVTNWGWLHDQTGKVIDVCAKLDSVKPAPVG